VKACGGGITSSAEIFKVFNNMVKMHSFPQTTVVMFSVMVQNQLGGGKLPTPYRKSG
jgi:hypothetical protein